MNIYTVPTTAFASEKITVSTTAIGFTAAKILAPNGMTAKKATFQNVDANYNARFLYDGTAPDATTGLKLTPGTILSVAGEDNVKRMKFIRQDAFDVIINATYEY